MTNNQIILLMRGINKGRVTWEEIRDSPNRHEAWKFLNADKRFVPYKPFHPRNEFIEHWVYVGKRK